MFPIARPFARPAARLAALAVSLAALVLVARADAAFPDDPPNDPRYAPATGCPPPDIPMQACEGVSGQWNLFGYWPNNPPDPGHASGISADLAWEVTTGDPSVVITVLDTGVNYDHEDLRNQIWLNRTELPAPDGSACAPPAGDAYDCNNDGVFNVLDYADDSRITIAILPAFLSRSDLRVFEDGIDGDGNGFTDDISGWDARDGDNDEYRTNGDGHGTGRNGFIAAQANNGVGIAGICPDCQLANIRVDHSFVTRTESVGIGAIWAADHGHDVISMALGATGASSMTRAAFDYATRNNVLAVNATANEFSFHQNFQTVFDDVMGIGGVVPDTPQTVSTYLRKANFSNYGANIDVVAPTDAQTTSGGDSSYGNSSGTSSAVPHAAGVAGLVFSRARELISDGTLDVSGFALQDVSAQEVRQIINGSADDIVKTDDPAGPYLYKPGWDRWTGYGRLNARAAVDMVTPVTIPPEADINSPDWFTNVNGDVPVSFYANARWADTFDWVLEVGAGVEPASWTSVDGGVNEPGDPALSSASFVSNFTAPWDAGALADGLYTLRLTITDNLGNTGEDRMAIWVRADDPQSHAGFPLNLGASLESVAGGALVDLDGDNELEIILSDGDGEVHALRQDGSELPGFPVQSNPVEDLPLTSAAFDGSPANGEVPVTGSSITGGVTVADIDADGMQEICAGAYDGRLYCWNEDGSTQPGFPVSTITGVTVDQYSGAHKPNHRGEAILTPPAVADLDGDGRMELVAGAFDQRLYVWHSDGTPMAPWPLAIYDAGSSGGVNIADPRPIISHPLIADIDADGVLEIVFGTNETYDSPNFLGQGGSGRVYAYEPDGSLEPGWPVKPASVSPDPVPLVAEGAGTSPIAADIDGDGTLEIAAGVFASDATIYNHDGTVFATMSPAMGTSGPGGDGEETTAEGGLGKSTDTPLHYYVAGSAFADVETDGRLDFLSGMLGNGILAFAAGSGVPTSFDHYLANWDAESGVAKPAFPRVIEDWMFFTGPSVADIDGAPGGTPEMIVSSGGFFVHAFNAAGLEPAGWPKNTGHWIVMSPTIGDIDADGQLEVVVVTRMGDVYFWDTPGPACGEVQWRKALHDEWNTGLYGVDTLRPNVALDVAYAHDKMQWTAPGDDGACGQASAYDIRYTRTAPLTEDNWGQAFTVDGEPPVQAAGSTETFTLPSLVNGLYYFGVRTRDEAGNLSALSNLLAVCVTPDGISPDDADCDGYSTPAETTIGTDPDRACAATATPLDERGPAFGEPLSPWPPDMNDDRQVNLADVLRYNAPGVFGVAAPAPAFNPRYDLDLDGQVNLDDVLHFNRPGLFGSACQ